MADLSVHALKFLHLKRKIIHRERELQRESYRERVTKRELYIYRESYRERVIERERELYIEREL